MQDDIFETLLTKEDIIKTDDTPNIVKYEPLVLQFFFMFVHDDSKELYLHRFIRIIEMCLHISKDNIKHKFKNLNEDDINSQVYSPDLIIEIYADFKRFDPYRLFNFFLIITESTDKTVSIDIIDIYFNFNGKSCCISRNDYLKNEISMQNLYDIARILSKLKGYNFLKMNSYSRFLRVPLFNKWVEPKFNRWMTDKTIEFLHPDKNFIMRKQRLYNFQSVIPFINSTDDIVLTVFKVIPVNFQKNDYFDFPNGFEALSEELQNNTKEFKKYIKKNISHYPVKSIMTMFDYESNKSLENCKHVMALGYLHCPITDEYYFVTALRNIWFKKSDNEDVVLKEFIDFKKNITYVPK